MAMVKADGSSLYQQTQSRLANSRNGSVMMSTFNIIMVLLLLMTV